MGYVICRFSRLPPCPCKFIQMHAINILDGITETFLCVKLKDVI